ncbi:MAG TPA: outer membrane beta-barrel protein [Bacteroidales bacterium]|nr:outer membrane beta-barrel protein [Bacteroidales bacterium]
MRKFLLVFLFLMPYLVSGQSNYYVRDSVSSAGVKMIEGTDLSNSSVCLVINGDKTEGLTPEQISEYGYKNGRVYFSRKIQLGDTIKAVFLERLVKGKTALYYYKGPGIKEFFLEKEDGTLESLPVNDKNSFHSALSDALSDCPVIAEYSRKATYSKRSLSELITGYNRCAPFALHTFKYGVMLGYQAAKLVPSSNYADKSLDFINYKYEGSFAFGAFMDRPIMHSDFSLHLELYYSYNKYTYSAQYESAYVDLRAITSGISLPVMLRYTLQRDKTMPFINAGACYAFNTERTGDINTAVKNGGTIQVNGVAKADLISKNQMGFSIGSGMEYKLTYKRSLFFELRYNKLLNCDEKGARNISQFMLLTEINF